MEKEWKKQKFILQISEQGWMFLFPQNFKNWPADIYSTTFLFSTIFFSSAAVVDLPVLGAPIHAIFIMLFNIGLKKYELVNFLLSLSIIKNYILFRRALYRFSCFNSVVDVNKKNRPFIEKILVKIGQICPVEKIFKKRLLKS